jgi:hypothetical protein
MAVKKLRLSTVQTLQLPNTPPHLTPNPQPSILGLLVEFSTTVQKWQSGKIRNETYMTFNSHKKVICKKSLKI